MATPLEELGPPLAFEVDGAAALGLDAPSTDHDRSYRTRLRSLAWMQKEALVTGSAGETWRLPTDEGPYLDAADIAPPPLGCTTAGLLGSYAGALRTEAGRRGIDADDLVVTLECFYTAEGSALRGDRRAVVLPPELTVHVDEEVDERAVQDLVETAVVTAPVRGALGEAHVNPFALTVNGREVTPEGPPALDGSTHEDPMELFEALPRTAEERDPAVVRHTGRRTDQLPNAEARYAEKQGLDPSADPGHVVHLRGTCTPGDDGALLVQQETFSPRATVFEFLVDDPVTDGAARAPDALAYFSAGSVFCLTTHLAHYADVKDTDLDYRLVQDTQFSHGTGPDDPARADPAETHAFVETPGDEAFVQDALSLADRACYVHELWRSVVEPEVAVTTEPA